MLQYCEYFMWDAIILGIVQGITEFLPVSSSGHLVIVRDIFDLQISSPLAFDAVLHLATLLAVIIYFSKDLWVLMQAILRLLGRLPVNPKDVILLKALLIGTIPAGVLGWFGEDIISANFTSAGTTAIVLLLAAFFFVYAEWRYYTIPRDEELTLARGWKIGLFQALALIPGFSRSGATIAGGMMVGLSRYEATRFSFLLSIPIIAGAGLKKLLDLFASTETVEWGPLMAGCVVAFVVALLVIHYFIKFIRKYTLWPFVWYTFILAGFVGYYYLVV